MTLTIAFFIPFVINILILIIYLITKIRITRTLFFITLFIASGILFCISFDFPFTIPQTREVDFSFLYWLVSGYFFIASIVMIIVISVKLYIRYQDPENYHYNLFGKKVIHSGFMTNKEMGVYILTIPVILFGGAYFVGNLIKLISNWFIKTEYNNRVNRYARQVLSVRIFSPLPFVLLKRKFCIVRT